MNKQPKTLRLAAHAEANAFFGDMQLIAVELRRLHEVNAELLEALKIINCASPSDIEDDEKAVLIALGTDEVRAICAAIAKAEEVTP